MAGTHSTETPTDAAADDRRPGREHASSTGTAAWQKVVAIIGLVVLVWVGDRYYDVLTFDGVGGPNMEHGPDDVDNDREPGGQSPTGVQDPPAEPPAQDQRVDPDSGEREHDPSQFDHD